MAKSRFRIDSVNSVSEILVRDIVRGDFLERQRSVVPIGASGAGKTRLAIAIACNRAGARGRFFIGVDLVDKLEARGRVGRQGGLAEYPMRRNSLVLGVLDYLPFAQSDGQFLFHLISRLYE